jgi:hypothetical protein
MAIWGDCTITSAPCHLEESGDLLCLGVRAERVDKAFTRLFLTNCGELQTSIRYMPLLALLGWINLSQRLVHGHLIAHSALEKIVRGDRV